MRQVVFWTVPVKTCIQVYLVSVNRTRRWKIKEGPSFFPLRRSKTEGEGCFVLRSMKNENPRTPEEDTSPSSKKSPHLPSDLRTDLRSWRLKMEKKCSSFFWAENQSLKMSGFIHLRLSGSKTGIFYVFEAKDRRCRLELFEDVGCSSKMERYSIFGADKRRNLLFAPRSQDGRFPSAPYCFEKHEQSKS